jgi:hypothetical protein
MLTEQRSATPSLAHYIPHVKGRSCAIIGKSGKAFLSLTYGRLTGRLVTALLAFSGSVFGFGKLNMLRVFSPMANGCTGGNFGLTQSAPDATNLLKTLTI